MSLETADFVHTSQMQPKTSNERNNFFDEIQTEIRRKSRSLDNDQLLFYEEPTNELESEQRKTIAHCRSRH